MKIRFSERCAWRAFYIYDRHDTLHFYLGLDPVPDFHRPEIFFGWFVNRNWQGRVRFSVPALTWRFIYCKPRWFYYAMLPLYKLQQRILIRIDGRYGYRR